MDHLFDRQFQATMDRLCFSSREKKRMLSQLTQTATNSESRVIPMKKRTAGKVFAMIAACMLITAGSALAMSRIMWYEGSSNAGYDYNTTADMAAAQEEAQGTQGTAMPQLPDELTGGFQFDGGVQVKTQGKDEEDNVVGSWKDFHGHYVDAGGKELTVAMSYNLTGDDGRDATEVRSINDVPVTYNYDEYLFLPDEDTELDAKTKNRMEQDDHFFVSYGSDAQETVCYSSVRFQKGGISYSVFTSDKVSADELFSIAEELISR